MTDMSEIAIQSASFRSAIVQCSKQMMAFSFREFPLGSCGDASDMLGVFLWETLGIECEYTMGKAGGQSHAWLEFGGIKIDITADQFPGNESVIVSTDSEFHQQFKRRKRRKPGIDDEGAAASALRHDYELIVTAIKLATIDEH